MQCFGSQATLCGILILSCKFTAETFKIYGLSILPYSAFDRLAWNAGALTVFGAAGDAAGNIIFAKCWVIML